MLLERKRVPNFGLMRTTIVALALITMLALTIPAAQAQTFSILHNFTGNRDGGTPFAGLTIDQAGNFYGTTAAAGAGYGTVFKLTHSGSGWVLSNLYMFQGGNDGGYPYARVVFGPDGALYGTTSGYGGGAGLGTVFRLTPPSRPCRSIACPWTETVLYRFTGGADGANPGYGDVAFDATGNLYGTTMFGGGGANCTFSNCGVVFELSRSGGGWTESVLYRFTDSGDTGEIPEAGVILDSAGNLYGATFLGGAYNSGVAFQLTQSGSTWTGSALHSFGAIGDGAQPFGGLIIDRQGNLYGTTVFGPTNNNSGTVYELQPSDGSWTYSILAALPGSDQFGGGPEAALTMDSAGSLYGTTNANGSAFLGNVFKLTPSGGSWIYTSLHDFNGHDGAYPTGSVVLDAHGNIYGTTSNFEDGWGEAWEITP